MSGIALRTAEAELTDVAVTQVRFRPLSSGSSRWYLATGEWRERAGGYAIQGRGAALVESIERRLLERGRACRWRRLLRPRRPTCSR